MACLRDRRRRTVFRRLVFGLDLLDRDLRIVLRDRDFDRALRFGLRVGPILCIAAQN